MNAEREANRIDLEIDPSLKFIFNLNKL